MEATPAEKVLRRSTRTREQPQPVAPKRSKRQKRHLSPSAEPEHDYSLTTNPAKVDRPYEDIVHESLAFGWKVNNENKMCFIFNSANPARQLKRGMPFEHHLKFPVYNPSQGDLTENDCEPPGWMPFAVHKHKYVDSGLSSISDRLIALGAITI